MGRGLLIIVSGLFIIYGIIQHSLNQRQQTITTYNVNYASKTKAKTIASSMAHMSFAELNKHPQNSEYAKFPTENILGGKGSVSVDSTLPNPKNPFLYHIILTAVGKYNGETDSVVVTARRRAFSKYSYFTVEEPTIYFTSGDVLNGPVHTDGTIHIDGNPVFNGKVTSPNKPELQKGSKPVYNKGTDFNADPIDLPVQVPKLADAASSGGLRFTQPIKVDFFNDNSGGTDVGKVNISTGVASKNCVKKGYFGCIKYETSYTWNSPTSYNLSDYNGIISSSENVLVEGTLNGDYTVHSEKNVEIMGDIKYFDDPQQDPGSNDFLGIVSEGNTIVDKNAQKAHGSKDVTIQASIMALGDSFKVEDYNQGSERGTINLLGGLIQYKRGPVGTFSSYGGYTGYKKNYTYDQRFLGRSPRGFPPSDIYDFISWKTKY